MGSTLRIQTSIINDKTIVKLSGSVNNDTANLLSAELLKLDYKNLDLTIDLSDVDYVTSAGLRVFLVARKKLTSDTMRITNPNEAILDVFHMTGFDSFIDVKKDSCSDEDDKMSYSSLLNKRVNQCGNKVAYIYKNNKYTWSDIDVISSIIAHDLYNNGVKKGTHVGICGINSINWIFTFFAIQKLGGIAVLINPKLNPTEVKDVCAIGGVSHLCYAEVPNITTFKMYKESCLNNDIKFVYNFSDNINFLSRKNEFEAIKDKYREHHHVDDACLIIFTSGSTGKPKAVLSSAFSISSSVSAIIENFKVTDKEVNLAFLPFFHIFGFETNIVIGLLKAYCSIIPSEHTPSSMISIIEQYQCTLFNTVPTMMLGIVTDKTFIPEKLKSLRVSVLGGSATTSEQMSMLMKLLPNIHFGNIYGMSENASVAITDYNDSIEHLTQTVGKPVKGMNVLIRDQNGNSLEKGKVGEITIKSDSMLVCYYNLSVDKQPIDDEGWFSTGDLGYLDEDGYLRLTGRIKDLIICCGENISPEEVASAVSKINSVKEIKVIGVPHELKGEIVVAVVTIKDGYQWNENEARKEVAKCLAKYKQPEHYVVIPSFPMLASGKIDAITLKSLVLTHLSKK